MSTWRLTTWKKKKKNLPCSKRQKLRNCRHRVFARKPASLFFVSTWASEPLWDSDRWEASARWPFLNSAGSLQVSVIFILRGEAHGDPNLLGQEQKLRNCEWLRVWVRDECETLPWETATHGNTFPWTHSEIAVAVIDWIMFPSNPYGDALTPSTSECDDTLEREHLKRSLKQRLLE